MKREEFCCIIGYQGGEALVDKGALKAVKNNSIEELAKDGLYRAAFAAALYDDNAEEQDKVFQIYQSQASRAVNSREQLMAMLGIYPSHKEGLKIKLV
jgi:hypothetical protein